MQITSSSHACWRNCGVVEANHQIFWYCLKIDILGLNLVNYEANSGDTDSIDMCIIVLGDFPEELTRNYEYLLKILTAAAKKSNHL